MNRKDAINMLDVVIKEQKTKAIKNAIDDYTKEVRNQGVPLEKAQSAPAAAALPKPKMSAIKPPAMPKPQPQVVAKIDPATKLPGTLLDKQDQSGASVGSSMGSMTPAAITPTVKASPDMAPPMQANESIRASLAQKMSKCMKTLSAAEKGVHIAPDSKKPGASFAGNLTRVNKPENKAGIQDGHKSVLNTLQRMPKPNLPKSEMMKDDQPHAPNSPEDKAHDIAEEGQSIQSAAKDLGSKPEIKKMFEHLRSKRSNPNWERSSENRAAGMEKAEDPKDISAKAESAIEAQADKPMEEQNQRPGQANEPKEEKKP